MDILQLALGLIERNRDLLDVKAELVNDIANQYSTEVGETTDYVKKLFEARAGFARGGVGVCDENRLGDPRLRTTYPNERRRALACRARRYDDELAELLPKFLALTLKRELAQAELAEERQRDREYADAENARQELGVYVEVIDTIDTLYNDYGVTRRHYPCLSDEDRRDIAAIILRRPANSIPVKNRRSGREVRRG